MRLTLLWPQRIPPGILSDLDQLFGAVREVAAARKLAVTCSRSFSALGAQALLQWIGGALHVEPGI